MATHGGGCQPERKRVHVMEDNNNLDLILPNNSTSSPGSNTGDTAILEDANVQALGAPKKEEDDLDSPQPSPMRRLYRDKAQSRGPGSSWPPPASRATEICSVQLAEDIVIPTGHRDAGSRPGDQTLDHWRLGNGTLGKDPR